MPPAASETADVASVALLKARVTRVPAADFRMTFYIRHELDANLARMAIDKCFMLYPYMLAQSTEGLELVLNIRGIVRAKVHAPCASLGGPLSKHKHLSMT